MFHAVSTSRQELSHHHGMQWVLCSLNQLSLRGPCLPVRPAAGPQSVELTASSSSHELIQVIAVKDEAKTTAFFRSNMLRHLTAEQGFLAPQGGHRQVQRMQVRGVAWWLRGSSRTSVTGRSA